MFQSRTIYMANHSRDAVVEVFHPTRQLVKFLHRISQLLEILNLFRISPRGEAVNSSPYASPSFQVTKPR